MVIKWIFIFSHFEREREREKEEDEDEVKIGGWKRTKKKEEKDLKVDMQFHIFKYYI